MCPTQDTEHEAELFSDSENDSEATVESDDETDLFNHLELDGITIEQNAMKLMLDVPDVSASWKWTRSLGIDRRIEELVKCYTRSRFTLDRQRYVCHKLTFLINAKLDRQQSCDDKLNKCMTTLTDSIEARLTNKVDTFDDTRSSFRDPVLRYLKHMGKANDIEKMKLLEIFDHERNTPLPDDVYIHKYISYPQTTPPNHTFCVEIHEDNHRLLAYVREQVVKINKATIAKFNERRKMRNRKVLPFKRFLTHTYPFYVDQKDMNKYTIGVDNMVTAKNKVGNRFIGVKGNNLTRLVTFINDKISQSDVNGSSAETQIESNTHRNTIKTIRVHQDTNCPELRLLFEISPQNVNYEQAVPFIIKRIEEIERGHEYMFRLL